MKIKDIHEFRNQMLEWYKQNHRQLPWRDTDDPYRIWVSEVMLQQTQVKTVLPYYNRFCKQFPDVKSLAHAPEQSVLKLWEGLGYYARARNLHKSARVLWEKFDGHIPDNLDQIKQLPGIGDYIAAAVLSIAYHLAYPVVDGNVKRLLARLYCLDAPVNSPRSYPQYHAIGKTLIDSTDPGTFNQAMMELGAMVCKPKNPDCPNCPVRPFCMALKRAKIAEYPKRVKPRKTPQHHLAVGVVCKEGRVLITRRKSDGLLGGLWEFPGGTVRPGETAEDACVRKIKETVGLDVGIASYVTRVKHAYTHFKILADIYLCTYLKGDIRLKGPVKYRWIWIDEVDLYPFPKANLKFISNLKDLLKKQSSMG